MILKPIFAQLEITEGCTHKCTHCYNHYSESRSKDFVKKEVIDSIIKNEFFYITVTGGEPLMHKKILFDSIKKLKESNIDISLNSNLYLLKKEDAKILGDFKLNYVLSSIISSNESLHDKITQKKGSFKKLIRSLDYLMNSGVNVSMNMVVSQENINDVYPTGRFVFDNFGIKRFSATPIVPSSEKEKDLMLNRKDYIKTLDELLKLEKDFGIISDSLHPAIPCMFNGNERGKYRKFFEKRGCAAGKGAVTFSPLGDVRVCSHERKVYGNILENSFEEILYNMKEWTNESLIPVECTSCSYLNKCRGGCRVSAEIINGMLNSPDPYFIKPVKEEFQEQNIKQNLGEIKPIKGNIRYRKDNEDITTIYITPNINARLNKLEFEFFKRYLAGKSYEEISKELEDSPLAKNVSYSLINKGLLI